MATAILTQSNTNINPAQQSAQDVQEKIDNLESFINCLDEPTQKYRRKLAVLKQSLAQQQPVM
jgi:peptidoglycan hydrolase CwlO-like protein